MNSSNAPDNTPNNAPDSNAPDTIVLVHGLWVTPRSWEGWKAHYEAQGFIVLTPAYPGFEIEVEALRNNPDVISDLTVPETVDHLAGIVESLPKPPMDEPIGRALSPDGKTLPTMPRTGR